VKGGRTIKHVTWFQTTELELMATKFIKVTLEEFSSRSSQVKCDFSYKEIHHTSSHSAVTAYCVYVAEPIPDTKGRRMEISKAFALLKWRYTRNIWGQVVA
jgi:hypothetical protein